MSNNIRYLLTLCVMSCLALTACASYPSEIAEHPMPVDLDERSFEPNVNAVAYEMRDYDLDVDSHTISTRQIRIVNMTTDGNPGNAARFNRDYDAKVIRALEIANQDFTGSIEFRLADRDEGSVVFAKAPNDLRYYYDGLRRNDGDIIAEYDSVTMPHAEKGIISVFVFDTPLAPDSIITGFTQLVSHPHDNVLERLEPQMDRICISYRGLGTGTLSHELGHYFYLAHTWEIIDRGLAASYGFTDQDAVCTNRMSYNCYKDGFTLEQKEVVNFADTEWRHYLES